jgi:hypothetical protein
MFLDINPYLAPNVQEYMKKCSTPSMIREMKNKSHNEVSLN